MKLRIALCALALPGFAGAGEVGAAEKMHPADEFCAGQWRSLKTQNGNYWQQLHTAWVALEDQCRKTGLYEYHLATLEEQLGNRDQGIRMLESALERKLPYHDVSYTTLTAMRFRKAFTQTPPDLASARKFAAEVEAFANQKTHFYFARQTLIDLKLMLEDYAGAIDAARLTLASVPDASNARRALVIALGRLENYPEARAEIEPALKADNALASDPELMYVVSTVYLKVGDVESAENALLLLLDRKPELKGDPEFLDMAHRVIAVKNVKK